MGGTQSKPETETRRIVLLGKTGVGKSSLVNTIFGKDVFKVSHTSNSETKKCQAETRSVNGRRITLIDTPGFFDTDRPEEELRTEIVRCITECAPGPHAFLIVLKVEKFTEQENDVIRKICEYFSEEAFKYAAVVFTHGQQLPERMNIKEFVQKNKDLRELVKKCGGRCHVYDNKYWKIQQKNKYRSNQFQVEQLLNTVDDIVMGNKEGYYTNEMLQTVETEIQQEEEIIRLLPEKRSEQEIRAQAKVSVFKKLLIRLTGIATGVLLGAFFGVVVMVRIVATALNETSKWGTLRDCTAKTAKATAGIAIAVVGETAVGRPVGGAALCTVVGACAVAGAVKGGLTGYDAAEGAASPWEAAKRAATAVEDKAQSYLDEANDVCVRLQQSESQQSQTQ